MSFILFFTKMFGCVFVPVFIASSFLFVSFFVEWFLFIYLFQEDDEYIYIYILLFSVVLLLPRMFIFPTLLQSFEIGIHIYPGLLISCLFILIPMIRHCPPFDYHSTTFSDCFQF